MSDDYAGLLSSGHNSEYLAFSFDQLAAPTANQSNEPAVDEPDVRPPTSDEYARLLSDGHNSEFLAFSFDQPAAPTADQSAANEPAVDEPEIVSPSPNPDAPSAPRPSKSSSTAKRVPTVPKAPKAVWNYGSRGGRTPSSSTAPRPGPRTSTSSAAATVPRPTSLDVSMHSARSATSKKNVKSQNAPFNHDQSLAVAHSTTQSSRRQDDAATHHAQSTHVRPNNGSSIAAAHELDISTRSNASSRGRGRGRPRGRPPLSSRPQIQRSSAQAPLLNDESRDQGASSRGRGRGRGRPRGRPPLSSRPHIPRPFVQDDDEPLDYDDEESRSTESFAPSAEGRDAPDDHDYVSDAEEGSGIGGNLAKRKGRELDDGNAAKRAKLGQSSLYKEAQDALIPFLDGSVQLDDQPSSSKSNHVPAFYIDIPPLPSPRSMATRSTASATPATTAVPASKGKGKEKEVVDAGPSMSANTATGAPVLAPATATASTSANPPTTANKGKGKQKEVARAGPSTSTGTTANVAASTTTGAASATAGPSAKAKSKGKQNAGAASNANTRAPAAGPSTKPTTRKPKNLVVDPETGETTVKNKDHRLTAANGLQLAQQIAGALRYRADKEAHVAGIQAFQAAELRRKAEVEQKTAELYVEFLHLAISATENGIGLPNNMNELANQLAKHQQQRREERMDDD